MVSDIRYPMADSRWTLLAAALLALVATAADTLIARQMPAAPVYAIQNAKIVTGTATIEKGNLIMRNGVIEAVGAAAAIPADAIVVDGANTTVYPGLIDMSNTTALEGRVTAA